MKSRIYQVGNQVLSRGISDRLLPQFATFLIDPFSSIVISFFNFFFPRKTGMEDWSQVGLSESAFLKPSFSRLFFFVVRNFCRVILKSVRLQRNKRDMPHWGGFIGCVCFVPLRLGFDPAIWGTRGLCPRQGTAGLRAGSLELSEAPTASKLSLVFAVPYLGWHLECLSCKQRWSSMHVGDRSWKPTRISITGTSPPRPLPSPLLCDPQQRSCCLLTAEHFVGGSS